LKTLFVGAAFTSALTIKPKLAWSAPPPPPNIPPGAYEAMMKAGE